MADGSHLLRLPGELRNRIYEEVFDDIATLYINKNGFLVPDPLALVCRQIHEEVQASGYLDHSLATRPSIRALEAQIIDWDFGHVVKFLGRVAEHGLAGVEELYINVLLTDANLEDEVMCRWLDCITTEDPECPYAHMIDFGNQNMKPVAICYDVQTKRKLDDTFACRRFALAMKRLHRSSAWNPAWYPALGQMVNDVRDTQIYVHQVRRTDERDRRTRRFIRASERGRAPLTRHWLQKIKRACLNGQDTSTLYHMFHRPADSRVLNIEPHGGRVVTSKRPLEVLLQSKIFEHGHSVKHSSRQTSTTLAKRCYIIRNSRDLYRVRK